MVNRLPRIPTQLAWAARIKHITELKDLWPLLWDANRTVAETYGLDAGDFAHVLASFPGLARKRREFHAYLLGRLAEWRAELAMSGVAAGMLSGEPVPMAAETPGPSARPRRAAARRRAGHA